MAVAGGDLEASTREADGAVGSPLGAADLGAEGASEVLAAGAFPPHIGACKVALKGGTAELGMEGAMVLALDPGLGGPIEQIERKFFSSSTPSSIAIRRPSTLAQKISCLAF